MIIVPIAGDSLKTKDGLPFKVLAYTNYKSDGPAVVVQATVGQETVQFSEIETINDHAVEVLKDADGYNVLSTDSYVHRKFSLPQPGDFIKSSVSGIEERSYQVKRIRLHIQGNLAGGMIFDAQERDDPAVVEISLDQISNIDHTLFNRDKFLAYYADYVKKGSF